jgi:hypothetical protein
MTTIIKPDVYISEETRKELVEKLHEEGQVVLHVDYLNPGWMDAIRIWPTTFLIPKDGGENAKLITAEKIGIFPQWLIIPMTNNYRFTLIFSPLPKSCLVFDMAEIIPEPNGFFIGSIQRNKTDVYVVTLD